MALSVFRLVEGAVEDFVFHALSTIGLSGACALRPVRWFQSGRHTTSGFFCCGRRGKSTAETEAVSMKVLILPRIRRWSLAEVHIQDGETLENALRRFKRKVLQEEIIKEVKRHAFYLKPGQKKRIKSVLARKRNRKKRTRDSALEQN